jgi:predicted SnoaL-like aldol condensation-catalyzing enzyme
MIYQPSFIQSYDCNSLKVAFEVFRFENGLAVEHWDNIQEKQEPNHSGRSMLDGDTELKDLGKTENNRIRVKKYVETVLINQKIENLADFVNNEKFIQHSPKLADGIEALRTALLAKPSSGQNKICSLT